MAERLLLDLNPATICEELVRKACHRAQAMNCPWAVVYVRSPCGPSLPERLRLMRVISLVRELGGEIHITEEDDYARAASRTEAASNVSEIIVGRSPKRRAWPWSSIEARLRRLIQASGEIAVRVVAVRPPKDSGPGNGQREATLPGLECLCAAWVVAAMTGVNLLLNHLIGYQSIAWLSCCAVVFLACFLGRGATLLGAMLSALSWDYFFIEPHYSLKIVNPDDRVVFALYFVIAVVMSQFMSRSRRQAREQWVRAERIRSNFILTKKLATAAERDEMLCRAVEHIRREFGCQPVVLLPDGRGRLVTHRSSLFELDGDEYHFASSVFEPCGTNGSEWHAPPSGLLFSVLRAEGSPEGIMAFRFQSPLRPPQRMVLEEQTQQVAVELRLHRLRAEGEMSKRQAESARLSQELLDAMTQEIRTSLTAIQMATENLVMLGNRDLSPLQSSMVSEIQEAASRLNGSVNKVRQMDRPVI
jgi:two-component system, OmpR family, sensor histidine kinase KdpD